MKKIIALLLTALLLCALCVPALAAPNGKLTEGAALTAADARLILRAAVGLDTLTAAQSEIADIDLDGKVTASDARIALRVSVGLDLLAPTYVTDAYAALRGGHFYAAMPMNEEGMEGEMTLAFTADTTYLRASVMMEGMKLTLPMLKRGGKTYLMEETHACYAQVTDADKQTFSKLGLDLDEFFDEVVDFSEMPALSYASGRSEELFHGERCVCYAFPETSGGSMLIYMKGRQLRGFKETDAAGNLLLDSAFSAFSIAVPAACTAVPSSYEALDSAEDLFMILMLSGVQK